MRGVLPTLVEQTKQEDTTQTVILSPTSFPPFLHKHSSQQPNRGFETFSRSVQISIQPKNKPNTARTRSHTKKKSPKFRGEHKKLHSWKKLNYINREKNEYPEKRIWNRAFLIFHFFSFLLLLCQICLRKQASSYFAPNGGRIVMNCEKRKKLNKILEVHFTPFKFNLFPHFLAPDFWPLIFLLYSFF